MSLTPTRAAGKFDRQTLRSKSDAATRLNRDSLDSASATSIVARRARCGRATVSRRRTAGAPPTRSRVPRFRTTSAASKGCARLEAKGERVTARLEEIDAALGPMRDRETSARIDEVRRQNPENRYEQQVEISHRGLELQIKDEAERRASDIRKLDLRVRDLASKVEETSGFERLVAVETELEGLAGLRPRIEQLTTMFERAATGHLFQPRVLRYFGAPAGCARSHGRTGHTYLHSRP